MSLDLEVDSFPSWPGFGVTLTAALNEFRVGNSPFGLNYDQLYSNAPAYSVLLWVERRRKLQFVMETMSDSGGGERSSFRLYQPDYSTMSKLMLIISSNIGPTNKIRITHDNQQQ